MARHTSGSSQYIDLGDPYNTSTGAYTVGLWIKCPSSGNANLDKIIDNNDSFTIDFRTASVVIDIFVKSGGSYRSPAAFSAINDDSWHFMCVDFQDGSSGAINGFKDDMDTAETSTSGSWGTFDTTLNNMGIGARLPGASNEGQIDFAAVFIFYSVLSASERKHLKVGLPIIASNKKVFLPCHGNLSPEPNYIMSGLTGSVTGATKSSNPPNLELLENFI